MVTYRSITIELRSQYDLLALPEFAPEPANGTTIQLKDNENARVSVFVPIYASSQFWICYSIAPPHPPSSYFYFKLFIDGIHIVSWGCGEEDNYRGKTMYALFDEALNKKTTTKKCRNLKMEKRSFFFPTDSKTHRTDPMQDLEGRFLEIKVYRSNARRRIVKDVEKFSNDSTIQHKSERIRLMRSGEVSQGHPQRFYQYALIDPVEQPFAAFRYFYRTWDELHCMGLTDASHRSMSTISEESTTSSSGSYKTVAEERLSSQNGTFQPSQQISVDAAAANYSAASPIAATNTDVQECPRLSFPPPVQLLPTGQLPLQTPAILSNIASYDPDIDGPRRTTDLTENVAIKEDSSYRERERFGRLRLFRSIAKGRQKVPTWSK